MTKKIGIIGGSGLYEMEGLTDVGKIRLDTPFGEPSAEYVRGRFGGDVEVYFLPRHGIGHRLLPGEINYRANIHGFRQLGCGWVLSVSAVGSLKEEIRPGDMVVPDQFFDRTRGRASTFFGGGVVAHVAFGDPVCPVFRKTVVEACRSVGVRTHEGGTYVCMEGPQFSTRAESVSYRSLGASVIGMTNIPEVKLAREAELCFATLALATDYDCWRESGEEVRADTVVETMKKNVVAARSVIRAVLSDIPSRTCECKDALRYAVVTDPSVIPPAARERLDCLIGPRLTKD